MLIVSYLWDKKVRKIILLVVYVLHSTTQYYTVRMLCETVESPF